MPIVISTFCSPSVTVDSTSLASRHIGDATFTDATGTLPQSQLQAQPLTADAAGTTALSFETNRCVLPSLP